MDTGQKPGKTSKGNIPGERETVFFGTGFSKYIFELSKGVNCEDTKE